jgi:anti-sigma B factor antagonist
MNAIFEVDRSQVDGQARLRFVGELDIAEAPRAEREALEVFDQTTGVVTIDLSGLTFCDVSGVRVLHNLNCEAMTRGRRFVLEHPSPGMLRVLSALGMLDFFTITDDLERGA